MIAVLTWNKSGWFPTEDLGYSFFPTITGLLWPQSLVQDYLWYLFRQHFLRSDIGGWNVVEVLTLVDMG